MNFVWFALGTLALSLLFVLVFSAVSVALALGLVGVAKLTDNKAVLYPLGAVAMLISAFVILWWDAYVAARTVLSSSRESVSFPWLYVVVGLLGASSPLWYLAGKERLLDARDREAPSRGKQSSQLIFIALSAIGFLAFYFFPPLMFSTYGWFLDWWFGK